MTSPENSEDKIRIEISNELYYKKNYNILYLYYISVKNEEIFIFIFFMILIMFTLIFSSSLGLAAQGIALILNSTITLQTSIMEFLERLSNLESNMVSVDRLMKYIDIPSEAPYHKEIDISLTNWPCNGEITFKNFVDNHLITINWFFLLV